MFLDTARLGLMSPAAQRAQADFARLAGDEGASPRFERFLLAGFDEPATANRYPGLASWRGVRDLKAKLRTIADGPPDLPILLASRSAVLMRLAARLLCHPCRNVLTADLGWPGYHAVLAAEAVRAHRAVTVVRLRDDVLAGHSGAEEIIGRLRAEYRAAGCDGVFLPAVSSDGVRLPVRRLLRELEAVREPRFVVVDGAQAFGHVPGDLADGWCDLYLAGCHKWLGGYHPLGVGVCGRRPTAALVENILGACGPTEFDDPLLWFTTGLEGMRPSGETLGLMAMFTARAAAADVGPPGELLPQLFGVQLANVVRVAETAAGSGWHPLLTAPDLRSGILLARTIDSRAMRRSGEETRARFAAEGVVATGYGGGVVRLSMPRWELSGGEIDDVARVFCRVAG